MIKIELYKPVILFSQLPAAAEKLGIELEKLQTLANGGCIITEDVAITSEDEPMAYAKYDLLPFGVLPDTSVPHLYGSEGVIWFCDEKGVELQSITAIDLPNTVYFEATDSQWLDLSESAAYVELYNDRVRRLSGLHAPEIILINETRMLREKIEILESNRYGKPMTHEDGTLRRALRDIGYSLVGGWDPEMLKEFERRKEEAARERAKAEQEAN